jgi:hypothetical protein
MKNVNKQLSNIVVWLIKNIWQKRLSIRYKNKYRVLCRFYPSCSEYAILAIEKYGLIKGVVGAIKRLKRCTIENTDSCYDLP